MGADFEDVVSVSGIWKLGQAGEVCRGKRLC